jgi:hypothetical protein
MVRRYKDINVSEETLQKFKSYQERTKLMIAEDAMNRLLKLGHVILADEQHHEKLKEKNRALEIQNSVLSKKIIDMQEKLHLFNKLVYEPVNLDVEKNDTDGNKKN